MDDWMQLIIGPLISVGSIFISNWLGRKSVKNNYQLETKDKAYSEFYIPLMKKLTSANKDSMTYYTYVAVWYGAPKEFKKRKDDFSQLFRANLEYLPPKIIKLVPEYMTATSGAQLFFGDDGYRENYRNNLIKASDLFDEIIKLSLKEASSISNELGYPDIAEPILKLFTSLKHSKFNYPRYLPEIHQDNLPRQFTGEEPPYY